MTKQKEILSKQKANGIKPDVNESLALAGLLITLKRYLIKHSANSNNVLIFTLTNTNNMAAGDRNKSGIPKDFVRHYGTEKATDKDYLLSICGNKRAGYVTNDIHDVTCVKCTCKMLEMACEIKEKFKGFFPNPNK